MSQCNKLMCKYNLNDKKETKKWLLNNHPDKLNDDSKIDPNFTTILECYTNNNFCNKKSKNTNKKNNKVSLKNREKIFKCMRKVANFSKIVEQTLSKFLCNSFYVKLKLDSKNV